MLDSLSDPYLIGEYHQEYLSHINFFNDLKRPSSFVKYYNINFAASLRRQDIKSVYDLYNHSGVHFNIYDLTPTYNVAPIISSSSFVADKKGQMFDGMTTISLYSIETPHLDDLIVFYSPIKDSEIYRVVNMKTSVNAVYSDPEVHWYELDLELAPIKSVKDLKIFEHYVYDIPLKRYRLYNSYVEKLEAFKRIDEIILDLMTPVGPIGYYDRLKDLYCSDNLTPTITNYVILAFKNSFFSERNYSRFFDKLLKPYGFLHNRSVYDENYNELNPVFPEIVFDSVEEFSLYDSVDKSFQTYTWDRDVTSKLNTLLSLSKELHDLHQTILNL